MKSNTDEQHNHTDRGEYERHKADDSFESGDLAWMLFILFVAILLAPFHLAVQRLKRWRNRD